VPVDFRWDPFTNLDQSILAVNETFKVPATSPYYVPLLEVPREEQPSTVLIRAAGGSGSAVADQNCYIQSSNASSNFATGPLFYCGKNHPGSGTDINRGFIHFNIGSLPSVADSAILRINVSTAIDTVAVGVHKVTSSWLETAPTWTTPPTYETAPTGSFNIVRNIKGEIVTGWHEVDVTGLYNAWKAGTVSNNGVMLKADETVSGRFGWTSRFAAGVEPTLVVVGAGNLYTEVAASVAPVSGQFSCHYPTGTLRFHSSAAGLSLAADYRATGSAISATHTSRYAGLTTGTGTAYICTVPGLQRLYDGFEVQIRVHTGNTGSCTINPNALGAVTCKRFGVNLTSSQLQSGGLYSFVYDRSDGFFHLKVF
jgi:hypothetical protein